ncbi:transposase domain-containing protein [Streptomyces sp. KMM 9044]|nr:transposase domain-containing protein [Streptomyces sp. KMM 9044]WAX79411.1 transposase domain-containing protein [Streptomyces sp. KMM 9044]
MTWSPGGAWTPRPGQVEPGSDGQRLPDRTAVGLPARAFPPEWVDRVVARRGRKGRRSRLLPPRAVVCSVPAARTCCDESAPTRCRRCVRNFPTARTGRRRSAGTSGVSSLPRETAEDDTAGHTTPPVTGRPVGCPAQPSPQRSRIRKRPDDVARLVPHVVDGAGVEDLAGLEAAQDVVLGLVGVDVHLFLECRPFLLGEGDDLVPGAVRTGHGHHVPVGHEGRSLPDVEPLVCLQLRVVHVVSPARRLLPGPVVRCWALRLLC